MRALIGNDAVFGALFSEVRGSDYGRARGRLFAFAKTSGTVRFTGVSYAMHGHEGRRGVTRFAARFLEVSGVLRFRNFGQ